MTQNIITTYCESHLSAHSAHIKQIPCSSRTRLRWAPGPDESALVPPGKHKKKKIRFFTKMNRVILNDYCISEACNPEHAHNYPSLAYATAFAQIFSRKNGSCSMTYIQKWIANIIKTSKIIFWSPFITRLFLTVKFKEKMKYQLICNVKVSKSLRVYWLLVFLKSIRC